ncbi:MAG: ParA family protein, partial [Nitrospirae bacterium]|nr:ParA family protein [Nitrospirota bacterium]
MGRIIAIANQKGGVGKTTTAINLSASLAVAGKTTLLIDLDPQGNATSGLGISREEKRPSIYDLLIRKKGVDEIILNTATEGLQMIPSGIDLVGAEVELIDMDGRETVLKGSISDIRSRYDFILIDCPPSLGFLTINALTASDSVMIPVQCEYYAMEGLGLLLKT